MIPTGKKTMPQDNDPKVAQGGDPTSTERDIDSVYFMTYRHGMNPFCFKGFHHKGDLKSAKERAFKHGNIMGYKNIWVMPLCVNLDREESMRPVSNETKVQFPPDLK